MSDPHPVDSLDEFPPESLDLYSSTPSPGLAETAGLIAIVPAPAASAAQESTNAASPKWHRRRRRWFRQLRASLPARQLRTEGARPRKVADSAHDTGPRKVADPSHDTSLSADRQQRRARIRRALTEAAGRDSSAQIKTVTALRPILSRVAASGSTVVAAGSAVVALQLRRIAQYSARALSVSIRALLATVRALFVSVRALFASGRGLGVSGRTLAMRGAALGGRAARTSVASARAIGAAATPVFAASRARVAPRLTHAADSVTSVRTIASRGADLIRRTVRTALTNAHTIAAATATTAAALPALIARRWSDVVESIASAHTVAVRLRSVSPRVADAARLAGRMLQPGSVAIAGVVLALIALAGYGNISDISAGRAMPPSEPAATTPLESAARAPKMIVTSAPLQERAASAPVAAATVAHAPAASAPALNAPVTHAVSTNAPVTNAPVANAPAVNAPAVKTAAPRATDNPPARVDPRAIQTVLNRYRDAVSTLDVTAVRSVWPGADLNALQKEFAGVREQNVEFEGCRISGAGTSALASCAGVVESGFTPGDRRPRVERRRWQFTLRRTDAGWRIVEVQTQRG
jgi:hypothetical protein